MWALWAVFLRVHFPNGRATALLTGTAFELTVRLHAMHEMPVPSGCPRLLMPGPDMINHQIHQFPSIVSVLRVCRRTVSSSRPESVRQHTVRWSDWSDSLLWSRWPTSAYEVCGHCGIRGNTSTNDHNGTMTPHGLFLYGSPIFNPAFLLVRCR